MTWDERVNAVANLGLTQRQAGFLVMVMLHAGVCVGRQYCAYGRIAYGQKMHDFFRLLLARRFATARPCGNQNVRLYHVHHKPLYRAIGEADNRHRRPTTLPRAVERLMLLDAVLADRNLSWLATEREKVNHFTLNMRIAPADLPHITFRRDDSETVRYFPDKLPIAVADDRHTHTFVYLMTRDVPVDFRSWLERHAELFRALPAWTVRLLVPRHLQSAVPAFKAAFREQLATPLRPVVLEELRWYFRARRAATEVSEERFDQAARAFSAPRFGALYRAWLHAGEPVLDAMLSPTLADAIGRGTGLMDCQVLPHRYQHLLPLVGTA